MTTEKISIDALDEKLTKKLGEYFWLEELDESFAFDIEDFQGAKYVVQVPDHAEASVRNLILANGYEIVGEEEFCGSDYDGTSFYIR